jgi:hypothetical protein
LEALRLSGTYDKNKGRYSNRREQVDDRPLDEPPQWLSPAAQEAWREMASNLPWLRYCHRSIVGITALLVGKMSAGELGVPGMSLLRQCLGKLGATPADALRVGYEAPEVAKDDPAEKYFL